MTTATTCYGCRAIVPATAGPTHRYIGASPGCWAIYGELLARDYGELAMPPEHRLVVDAYAAQHPGRESLQSLRSVAVHLIALHLVLERGLPPSKATSALQHFAKRSNFIWLDPPDDPSAINDMQRELADLRQRGWTLLTIAESLGVAYSTVKKWSAGMRYLANAQVVKAALKSLLEREPGRRRNPQPSALSYAERFAQVDKFRGAYKDIAQGRSMVEELTQDRIREARRETKEAERDAKKIARRFPKGLRHD